MLRLVPSARITFNLIIAFSFDCIVQSVGFLFRSRSRESNVPTTNVKAQFVLRVLRLQTQLA
jgi:hypothetical protein